MFTRPGIERRRQPRIQLEESTCVRIHIPRERPTGLINFSTKRGALFDLNPLGAFVSTDLDLQTGATVDLEIELPGMRIPELLHAEVARRAERFARGNKVKPAGVGLRFLADSDEEQQRVGKIVMIALTLDLLKYGYDNRKTIDFWTDVFRQGELYHLDWRPPHSTHTLLVSPSPEQTASFNLIP